MIPTLDSFSDIVATSRASFTLPNVKSNSPGHYCQVRLLHIDFSVFPSAAISIVMRVHIVPSWEIGQFLVMLLVRNFKSHKLMEG